MELIVRGRAEIVTVSLGADGALLATEAGLLRLRAPVKPRSAVGAGDSFVGAMTLGLARGARPKPSRSPSPTVTATVRPWAPSFCRREDVLRIYRQIKAEQVAPATAAGR